MLGLLTALAAANATPVLASETAAGCRLGDVCTLQGPLFGCRDFSDIKRWIDIYVGVNRDAAEQYIDSQVQLGLCTRFRTGERVRLERYLGLRRLEVRRPGELQSFITLLK